MISLVHLQEAGHQEPTLPLQFDCFFRAGQLSYRSEYGQGLAAGDGEETKNSGMHFKEQQQKASSKPA